MFGFFVASLKMNKMCTQGDLHFYNELGVSLVTVLILYCAKVLSHY